MDYIGLFRDFCDLIFSFDISSRLIISAAPNTVTAVGAYDGNSLFKLIIVAHFTLYKRKDKPLKEYDWNNRDDGWQGRKTPVVTNSGYIP